MAQADAAFNAIHRLLTPADDPRPQPKRYRSKVKEAHSAFVAALAANPPFDINYVDPSYSDIEGRAEHVEKIIAGFAIYLDLLLSDTEDHTRADLDRKYVAAVLSDVSATWSARSCGRRRGWC